MNASLKLQTAIKAAQAGSKIALSYYGTDLEIKTKQDHSFVTTADIETEKEIKKLILDEYPDAKFLAEESGGSTNENDFWIIDPIDGTRLFIRGITQWSILISHYENGEITTGVCYIPTQNILVSAEKGKRTFLNEKKVNVSTTPKLSDSFGIFGSFKRFKNIDPIMHLSKSGATLRSFEHSYALSLLAEGNVDFVIDAHGTPWDYAPFIRIIAEAGGKVTDFEGKEWDLKSKNLVASNGLLHAEILKIINAK